RRGGGGRRGARGGRGAREAAEDALGLPRRRTGRGDAPPRLVVEVLAALDVAAPLRVTLDVVAAVVLDGDPPVRVREVEVAGPARDADLVAGRGLRQTTEDHEQAQPRLGR